MPYLTYNLPIQRTGFRPYGHTNPWSATQLSGVGDHLGRPRQIFSEPGGRRLGMGEVGQWQSGFSPWILHSGLHGLGDDPNCVSGMPYDVNGNPCPQLMTTGYNVPDVTPASDCISAVSGLPIPCPGSPGSGGAVALPPGAAPRVPAPGTLFPQTSPQTIYSTLPDAAASASPYGAGFGTTQGCPSGYTINAQGKCAPSTLSEIGKYLPLIIGISAVALLLGGRR